MFTNTAPSLLINRFSLFRSRFTLANTTVAIQTFWLVPIFIPAKPNRVSRLFLLLTRSDTKFTTASLPEQVHHFPFAIG